jgi:hypothetical protein
MFADCCAPFSFTRRLAMTEMGLAKLDTTDFGAAIVTFSCDAEQLQICRRFMTANDIMPADSKVVHRTFRSKFSVQINELRKRVGLSWTSLNDIYNDWTEAQIIEHFEDVLSMWHGRDK